MANKYWMIVPPMPAEALQRTVREAEDCGLEGIWVPQLFSPPFPAMAAAAMATRSLKIGSGVALAFTRSPLETALNALDVDLISGGRTVLGLGTSIRDLNEQAHGVAYGKPVERLREVVRIVRDVIERGHTGELGVYESVHYKLDLRSIRLNRPVRPSIPIYLPALFESTIRLAAEVGDGLMGHPMWTARWWNDRASAVLGDALAGVKRARQAFHVALYAYVAIAEDRRRAIDEARGTVAFYSSIAQYEKYFTAHGFGDAARAVAAAAARGDARAMVAAVPDEMVEEFVAVGTPDEVRARVDELGRLAESITLIPPGTGGSLDSQRVAAYGRAIAETFFRN